MPKPISKTKPKLSILPLALVALIISGSTYAYLKTNQSKSAPTPVVKAPQAKVQLVEPINLPKPAVVGKLSLEAAIQARRSRRTFTTDKLNLKQISQMLWAGQGVTSDWGGRAAPSAKSAYPVTLYLASYNVEGLNPGLYEYLPGDKTPLHQLQLLLPGDYRERLAAVVTQASLKEPSAVIIIAGDFAKMSKAFDGQDMSNDVYLEIGHIAQNLYLQAESLKLGMVVVGGFKTNDLSSLLELPSNQTPIYVIPIGVPQP